MTSRPRSMTKTIVKTQSQSQQYQTQKISAAAERKIKIANRARGKAKETVLDAYKQLLQDGWSPIQAGDICKERLPVYCACKSSSKAILSKAAKDFASKLLGNPFDFPTCSASLLSANFTVLVRSLASYVDKIIRPLGPLSGAANLNTIFLACI